MEISLIQQTSSPYESAEHAQDALRGVSRLPGYEYGYVDGNRTVSFHRTGEAGSMLYKGQKRVFAITGAMTSGALITSSLQPKESRNA